MTLREKMGLRGEMVSIEELPPEVWLDEIGRYLDVHDLRCLSACDRRMRAIALSIRGAKGFDVRVESVPRLAAIEAVRDVARVVNVIGLPHWTRWQDHGAMFSALASFARVETVDLYFASSVGCWEALFRGCPRLRTLRWRVLYTHGGYHVTDEHVEALVRHGAPRLRELVISSSGLDMCHRDRARPPVLVAASDTLETYAVPCQAPFAVDSGVTRRMEIEERSLKWDESTALVVDAMGPRTKAACRELAWDVPSRKLRLECLAPFARLASLDVRTDDRQDALSRALAGLVHLPPSLERLRLEVASGRFERRARVVWPERALAHLTRLRRFEVSMLYARADTRDLLVHWMDAPAVEVHALFDLHVEYLMHRHLDGTAMLFGDDRHHRSEIETYWRALMEPVDACAAWLDAHPHRHAHVKNGPPVRGTHPRLHITVDA